MHEERIAISPKLPTLHIKASWIFLNEIWFSKFLGAFNGAAFFHYRHIKASVELDTCFTGMAVVETTKYIQALHREEEQGLLNSVCKEAQPPSGSSVA